MFDVQSTNSCNFSSITPKYRIKLFPVDYKEGSVRCLLKNRQHTESGKSRIIRLLPPTRSNTSFTYGSSISNLHGCLNGGVLQWEVNNALLFDDGGVFLVPIVCLAFLLLNLLLEPQRLCFVAKRRLFTATHFLDFPLSVPNAFFQIIR